jgi:hypothetical protein
MCSITSSRYSPGPSWLHERVTAYEVDVGDMLDQLQHSSRTVDTFDEYIS